MAFGRDELVVISTSGSLRRATFLVPFAGLEKVDEPRDGSYVAKADARLGKTPVVSLGNDRKDSCDVVVGVKD